MSLLQTIKSYVPPALRIGRRWREYHSVPQRLARIDAKVAAHYQHTVAAGPFRGMRYISEAFCGGYAPKVLGCYEAELHPVMETILRRDYTRIVDIGAAEGYYAVGLARHFPRSEVWAFEMVPRVRELCASLAQLNGVEARVHLEDACDVAQLRQLPLSSGTLVVCDCEGCEIDLIDPVAVPALAACDLLVELHDCFNPQITPTLLARFRDTHECTLVDSAPHDPAAFPAAHFLPRKDWALAVDDLRAASMQWAFLTVKPASSAAETPARPPAP